jgi:hypothetical protein
MATSCVRFLSFESDYSLSSCPREVWPEHFESDGLRLEKLKDSPGCIGRREYRVAAPRGEGRLRVEWKQAPASCALKVTLQVPCRNRLRAGECLERGLDGEPAPAGTALVQVKDRFFALGLPALLAAAGVSHVKLPNQKSFRDKGGMVSTIVSTVESEKPLTDGCP